MAKQNSDTTTPPQSVSGPNTMSILRGAAQSAKPPSAPSKSGGGLPQNRRGKRT